MQINKDLPGIARVLHLDWHDFFFYGQDEWKIRPNFTLTLGLRYENAGQPIQDLVEFNAAGIRSCRQRSAIRVSPIPGRDKNNFQPRIGFNWNPRTSSDGIMGLLTGGDKLVLRGGYTRTHDYAFTNIALNIWSSFPFVAAFNLTNVAECVRYFPEPSGQSGDLHPHASHARFPSPVYDSFSFELQREANARPRVPCWLCWFERHRAVREYRRQSSTLPEPIRQQRGDPGNPN